MLVFYAVPRLAALCLVALATTACVDLVEPPVASPSAAADSANTVPATAATNTGDNWLVLLYEDADDEILEEDMMNDLNEAELVGSSEHVTIVAQMDRYDGGYDGDGDWTTAKRFLVQQDDDLETMHSEELADLGEVDMAESATLVEFVTWAVKAYPADHHVLIMSDHGSGWPGGWNDAEPQSSGSHDIALAESFGNMLFLMEIGDALQQIVDETGIGKFELIGMDACLMSSIEVYSMLAPYARYAVASEEVEPTLGWAYAAFFEQLANKPSMEGAQLARAIVDSYIEQDTQIVDDQARARYVERSYDHGEDMSAKELAREEMQQVTLTAVDLSIMPTLVGALDDFVQVIAKTDQKKVAAARRYAQAFESVFDEDEPKSSIDLGSFARLVAAKTGDARVGAAANKLLAAIDQTVIDEKHGSEKPGATGIAIHFPNSVLFKDGDAGYDSYTEVATSFVQQSLWDDFLAFHYTKRALPAAASAPTANTATSAEPIADAEVAAPGAANVQVGPVTLSADSVSRPNPVTMHTTVSGSNIAFVYVYMGYLDKTSGDIKIMDMDFVWAEDTKEVDGVFYPNWSADELANIEFEWDGYVYAINDGNDSHMALLYPQDYGAADEAATYSVEGMYTSAKSATSRRATLLFSDGDLIRVLGYTGKEATGPLREISPKPGDRFTIFDTWIANPEASGGSIDLYSYEAGTLVFGSDDIVWKEAAAPRGTYRVGFIVEDMDGNWYESHAAVRRR